jgi:hypothetical protein
MGVFWDYRARPKPAMVLAFRDALAAPPPDPAALDREATRRVEALTETMTETNLNVDRLAVALGIVGLLIAAAITTDAFDLSASSTALYTLATTAFGMVVGLADRGEAKVVGAPD